MTVIGPGPGPRLVTLTLARPSAPVTLLAADSVAPPDTTHWMLTPAAGLPSSRARTVRGSGSEVLANPLWPLPDKIESVRAAEPLSSDPDDREIATSPAVPAASSARLRVPASADWSWPDPDSAGTSTSNRCVTFRQSSPSQAGSSLDATRMPKRPARDGVKRARPEPAAMPSAASRLRGSSTSSFPDEGSSSAQSRASPTTGRPPRCLTTVSSKGSPMRAGGASAARARGSRRAASDGPASAAGARTGSSNRARSPKDVRRQRTGRQSRLVMAPPGARRRRHRAALGRRAHIWKQRCRAPSSDLSATRSPRP